MTVSTKVVVVQANGNDPVERVGMVTQGTGESC